MRDIPSQRLSDSRGAEMVEWLVIVVLVMAVSVAVFRPAPGGLLYDALRIALNRIASIW